MKVLVAIALVVTAVFGVCAAQADSHTRTVELWTCKLEDGKTQEDVQVANGKWVKLMNASVEGGDVHSFVLTSVVGDQGTFVYADSFPSMEAWIASRKAMESEEGKALDKELNDVADCSSNALYESNESLAPSD